MTTPFQQNYACGLWVRTIKGHALYEHSGGMDGFSTDMAYYPDEKLTVVVLGNLAAATSTSIVTQLGAVARGEEVFLPSEHKEVAVAPDILARYVGVYHVPAPITGALANNVVITFEDSHLVDRTALPMPPNFLPKFSLAAESETQFILKIMDPKIQSPATFEIEFPRDEYGPASQLILHLPGVDLTGERLNDAEAKRITDATAAFDKRFKDQTAALGSEAAVRRSIDELLTNKPNYDLMTPEFATVARQMWPLLQPMFAPIRAMGAVQSVLFKGVGATGPDIYQVNFEKGSIDYRIWLAVDGKVDNATTQNPSQYPIPTTAATP